MTAVTCRQTQQAGANPTRAEGANSGEMPIAASIVLGMDLAFGWAAGDGRLGPLRPLPFEELMGFALDRSLLGRALEGDRVAFASFIKELAPHVERQLLRYPVTQDDREDLLQATLMQVVRRLGSFRGDSSFSTWLFRVTANEALMLMRSQRRHRTRLVEGMDFEDLGALPTMQESEYSEAGDALAANHERDARVREALAELPPDYREVVLAHYHMDLGLEEIAGQFDLSESAVRSRLHRARTRLRSILEGTPVAEEARAEARPERLALPKQAPSYRAPATPQDVSAHAA